MIRNTERLLGRSLDTALGTAIAARGKVRRNEDGNWELSLSLQSNDRTEETTLVARRCVALGEAAALKVALAENPVAVAETIDAAILAPAPTSLAPVPIAAPLSSPAAPSPVSPFPFGSGAGAAAPVPSSSWPAFGLRASSGATMGPLPEVAPGFALAGFMRFAAFRTEVGVQAFWGSEVRYPDLPDIGARLSLLSAMLRGCATAHSGRVEFPICLGVDAGWMHGDGFGLEATEDSGSAWAAVVVGPAMRLPLSRNLALWLEGDAVVSLLKPGFRVRNLSNLYRAPSGGSQVLAGIEVEVLP